MIRTRRRKLGLALGLLAVFASTPQIAFGQTPSVRIGVLAPRQPSLYIPQVLARLGELGYVEGKNLIVDYRSADGVAERFPQLARDLIRAKCDLIFAVGPLQAARALLDAKVDVPVVVLAVDYDPVKAGIVASLRRPGGNITGIFSLGSALAAKRLEFLREIVPKAKRILVLSDLFTTQQLEVVRQAADQLRVEIAVETFATLPYDLEAAFARGRKAGTEALLTLSSPALFDRRTTINQLVRQYRLPSVGTELAAMGTIADSENLIVYGAVKPFVRAADMAVSILKGAKAGDIPMEQPTEFELVVNLKAARALKISIPQSILLRANRVIE